MHTANAYSKQIVQEHYNWLFGDELKNSVMVILSFFPYSICYSENTITVIDSSM